MTALSKATIVPFAEIQAVADRIATVFCPRRIWLFGSYAYGTPTPDSDVDLLVVMQTDLSGAEQAAAIREAVNFTFPTDLLVRTPDQIEQRLAIGDPFIHEIVTKGVLLYEADHARVD
ncbi:MAG: nucleotidyltransferase domain-containing protein [Anaerolineae bacterium]|nr:nucleotidyltransferase domain-containing protein [Candidatus Roseilinea sp.]MDW8450810.1 nucleotidyltransferase domain-containing protein [Anaerolineae bacterium]